MAGDKTVRLYLPLPEELVILEVPQLPLRPCEALQLPFPPPYDPTGQPIRLWEPQGKNQD